MKKWLQVGLISLGCVGGYLAMRSLPVESCSFLHYGEFVNAEGVLEGCGYEETQFFRMDEIRYPILVELTPLNDAEVGVPLVFKLTLFTTNGKPIRWKDIVVSHTERIHALVVDPSLQDYQHVHPQPAGPEGHYLMEVTPRMAGQYRVYLDFITMLNNRRTLLEANFTVPGDSANPVAGHNLHSAHGEIALEFIPQQTAFLTGRELRFNLQATHSQGLPTQFAPVMDSYAHMVAFDAVGTGFAHLHPVNPFLEGQDPLRPELEFVFQFDQPGYYRVWAQVIINGNEIFAPFDIEIRES